MSKKRKALGKQHSYSRRQFIAGSASAGVLAALGGSGLASQRTEAMTPGRQPLDIVVERRGITIDGRSTEAVTLNGSVPGPLVRLQEGGEAVIRVENLLDEDTSIHWHGVLLPANMDGVPGVSFRGIAPGEVFTYRFPVRQNGTYWYHSHSGFQEQRGSFGPMIIDPAEPDPFAWDVEHVVMLSDWTFDTPARVLARLKKNAGYYNFQRPTIGQDGLGSILSDRTTWGKMRMDPTDIADVTGAGYTYLMNGKAPGSNWTGTFAPGQRVRLRIVNAGAATYFDVRIPGLEMTVVQVDGQNVQPVKVDEIRVAIAETYDVLVSPTGSQAFTIFAEATDRSGYARGTLAPREGMSAEIPARRERPKLTMKQMGMGGGMAAMGSAPMDGMDMAKGLESGTPDEPAQMPEWARPVPHGPDDHGPGNTRVPEVTRGQLDEPGLGLEDAPHRVLVYTDLRSLTPGEDARSPDREIELHLTGNMDRYIWGFDGKKYSESPEPIPFHYGERLRLTFVNDTMMNHPIHLHGMWMELVNGAGSHKPRKHTVNVKPAERVSVDITVDAPGRWAMHCHILYHMDAGMFRVVSVSGSSAGEAEPTR